jgi:hypothetical protein
MFELQRSLDACADWFDAGGKDTDHLLVVMGALCALHAACVECIADTSRTTIDAVLTASRQLRHVCKIYRGGFTLDSRKSRFAGRVSRGHRPARSPERKSLA